MTLSARLIAHRVLVLTGLVIGAVLLAPWFAPDDPDRIVAGAYQPAGHGHPLGTDGLGRDVFSRLLAGGRPLILLPVLATVLTCLLGLLIGMSAGYLGGQYAAIIEVLLRPLLVFPPILLLLIVLSGWGYSAISVLVCVGLTGAPYVSRLAQSCTRRVTEADFVEQATGFGERLPSVLAREILPNVAGPVLADAGNRLLIAIELVSAAAFLGFAPDQPNWAGMISAGLPGITLSPWGVTAPACALGLLAAMIATLSRRLAGSWRR